MVLVKKLEKWARIETSVLSSSSEYVIVAPPEEDVAGAEVDEVAGAEVDEDADAVVDAGADEVAVDEAAKEASNTAMTTDRGVPSGKLVPRARVIPNNSISVNAEYLSGCEVGSVG